MTTSGGSKLSTSHEADESPHSGSIVERNVKNRLPSGHEPGASDFSCQESEVTSREQLQGSSHPLASNILTAFPVKESEVISKEQLQGSSPLDLQLSAPTSPVKENEDISREQFQGSSHPDLQIQLPTFPMKESEVRSRALLQDSSPLDLQTQAPRVYKQKTFMYTGKEDMLLWKEYGIELHFPSCNSEVHIEVTVSVISTDDNYIFPEKSELVSAVYEVSADKPFPEPVTLKLQHSIPIDSEEAASAMSFVTASTEQGPPYIFNKQSGGIFKCRSSYGEMECRHFCLQAVIETLQWLLCYPIPFWSGVYCFQDGKTILVVTQNLAAHISAVKESFDSAIDKTERNMMIDRRSPGIELQVHQHPTWEVVLLDDPAMINMAVVLAYQPEKSIPQITMDIHHKKQGEEQPVDNNNYVIVSLTGVHEPKKIRLRCFHNKTTGDQTCTQSAAQTSPAIYQQRPTLIELTRSRNINVLEEIGNHYKTFGIQLLEDKSGSITDSIERENKFKAADINRTIIQKWLEGKGRQPKTWATLIKVLKDIELSELAREVEQSLLRP